jgi:outer membrane protein OmpA-like peptidoglycan-associated protein
MFSSVRRLQRIVRVALCGVVSLQLAACAPVRVPVGTLTPAHARVTNVSAAADAATFASWADRLARVESRATTSPATAATAAQAHEWLAYARELYGTDRQRAMVDTAFQHATTPIVTLETGMPSTTEHVPASAGQDAFAGQNALPSSPSPSASAVAWPAGSADATAQGALLVLLARVARGDTLGVARVSSVLPLIGVPMAVCAVASPSARLAALLGTPGPVSPRSIAMDDAALLERPPQLGPAHPLGPTGALLTLFARPIPFAYDSDVLDARSEAMVDTLAATIRADGVVRLVISGYTDPRGRAAYNLALSRRRAERVMRALRARGIAKPVEVMALGWADLASPGTDEAAYAADRRVEVRLIVDEASVRQTAMGGGR